MVEYHRGLPRITIPLPSRPEKCMFTLKPLTQTVGDFLEMLKTEDPAIVEAGITTTSNLHSYLSSFNNNNKVTVSNVVLSLEQKDDVIHQITLFNVSFQRLN